MSKENKAYSGPRRVFEKFKDTSFYSKLLGTLSLAATVNVPLWLASGIEDKNDVDLLVGGGWLAVALRVGIATRREYENDLILNPDKLRYSTRKDFTPNYIHIDEDDVIHESP